MIIVFRIMFVPTVGIFRTEECLDAPTHISHLYALAAADFLSGNEGCSVEYILSNEHYALQQLRVTADRVTLDRA